MKKGFVLWAGVLAVSIGCERVTAYTVTKAADKGQLYARRIVRIERRLRTSAYEEGGYPDLTYAAENAVKASR